MLLWDHFGDNFLVAFSCCIHQIGKSVMCSQLRSVPNKTDEHTVVIICSFTVNFDVLCCSRSYRWKRCMHIHIVLCTWYSLWELCHFLQCGANLLHQTTDVFVLVMIYRYHLSWMCCCLLPRLCLTSGIKKKKRKISLCETNTIVCALLSFVCVKLFQLHV